MAHIICPECGKKSALPDDMVGKKVKCQCGARFQVPDRAPAKPPPLPRQSCPHCQQKVLPNWKACPACGQRLPATSPPVAADQPGTPHSARTTISTGENSVVKATVNNASTAHVAGDMALPTIPARPAQPLISTGSESVVKAEIDASYNVSAAGDIVHHKEVHRTHRETHVHERDSAAGAVMKGLHRLFNPQQEEEERIHQECQAASKSDGALFAFVGKQIAAIESSSAPAEEPLSQARYSAGIHALEIIEDRNGERPAVLTRVDRIRSKLSALRPTQKPRNVFETPGGILGLLVVLAVAFIASAVMVAAIALSDASNDRPKVPAIEKPASDSKPPK